MTVDAAMDTHTRTGWKDWYDEQRSRFERRLAAHLERIKTAGDANSRLLDAVEYSLNSGGKRLRPILTLECARLCGDDGPVAEVAALAVECVHTFSLIHDDLPGMDDDDLRRGKPTNHKVFGEGLAILAGDWLLAYAFELLGRAGGSAEQSAGMVRALADGAMGMVLGQAADLAGEGAPASAELVDFIHAHKTARLIEACCRIGVLSAGGDETQEDALARYGRHLGLGFQIMDDVLDCTASTEQLGKRTNKDERVAKQTFPSVYGVAESRRLAQAQIEQAQAALAPFGVADANLRQLAAFVVTRDH